MLELRQRFIDLAVRPLAGKEAAEHLARGEMMDRLAHSEPGDSDDSLEAATAVLESTRGFRNRTIGAISLAAVFALTTVLVTVFRNGWEELVRLDPLHHGIPDNDSHEEIRERHLAAGMNAGQRLFLFANTRDLGDVEQRKWLEQSWETLPEDPAWFEEFVAASDYARFRLPERLRVHAVRIDPGNGLWPLIEANGIVSARGVALARRPVAPGSPRFSVSQANREAWAKLEEAARQPRMETRIQARTAERLRMLGRPVDLAGLADRHHFSARQRRFSPSYSFNDLWQSRAEDLALAKDVDGFRQWMAVWEKITLEGLRPTDENSPYDLIPYLSLRTSGEFMKQAKELGLTVEEAKMRRWLRGMSAVLPAAPPTGLEQKAGISALGDWAYHAQDIVTEAELEPGRRAEHAVADRFFAVVVAGLFGVLAVFAAFEGWRRPVSLQGLATGLFPLLRRVDFTWLAVLGIAVPIAWHVVVARFTPLGCRDFGLPRWDMIPAMAQAGGSFLLASCLLVQTARWRIAKRGGLVGLRPSLWQGWGVAGVAAIFVPAIGGVRYVPEAHHEEFLKFGSAVAGIPLLWLLWRASALFFCPTSAALGGVLACRMLVPGFIGAGVLLLALTPALKHEERRWIAQDQVGLPDPAGSGLNVLDARMMDRMRAQLRTALE